MFFVYLLPEKRKDCHFPLLSSNSSFCCQDTDAHNNGPVSVRTAAPMIIFWGKIVLSFCALDFTSLCRDDIWKVSFVNDNLVRENVANLKYSPNYEVTVSLLFKYWWWSLYPLFLIFLYFGREKEQFCFFKISRFSCKIRLWHGVWYFVYHLKNA